jgi:hypothetical protein
MADKELEFKIKTTADLTGVQQSEIALRRLREQQQITNRQAEAERKFAASQIGRDTGGGIAALGGAAQTEAPAAAATTVGTAAAIGTITFALNGAIRAMKEFNAEQDRWVDGMIKAQEKAYALGQAIVATQDEMISQQRLGTEPLEDSLQRLNSQLIRLQTEQSLLSLPQQSEDWNKYQTQIKATEGQIDNVTKALERQFREQDQLQEKLDREAERNRREKESFAKEAVTSAALDPQVAKIITQELAARAALKTGDARSADLFRQTEAAFRQGARPEQLATADALITAINKGNEDIITAMKQIWQ